MNRAAFFKAGVAIACSAALSGCLSTRYFGISTIDPLTEDEQVKLARVVEQWPATKGPCFSPGVELKLQCEALPLGELARSAQGGNRYAQMELARRYELGIGLPVNLDRAESLYSRAAASTGGPSSVWIPGMDGMPGYSIPIYTPYNPGLPEARVELQRIRAAREGPQPSAEELAEPPK